MSKINLKEVLKKIGLNENYPGAGLSTGKKVALGGAGLALVGTEGGRRVLNTAGQGINAVGQGIGNTVGKVADTAAVARLNSSLNSNPNSSVQTIAGTAARNNQTPPVQSVVASQNVPEKPVIEKPIISQAVGKDNESLVNTGTNAVKQMFT